jgi:tRNA-dihydrouridine synthase B
MVPGINRSVVFDTYYFDGLVMIKKISIGPLTLDDNVILAPITGVSDMPFRRIVKSYGAALVMSEMIASAAMIRETWKSLQMATKSPEEFPVAVQLAGCDPAVMAEAAKLNEAMGAHMIDINMDAPLKRLSMVLQDRP